LNCRSLPAVITRAPQCPGNLFDLRDDAVQVVATQFAVVDADQFNLHAPAERRLAIRVLNPLGLVRLDFVMDRTVNLDPEKERVIESRNENINNLLMHINKLFM
jgi:hypothetical protein